MVPVKHVMKKKIITAKSGTMIRKITQMMQKNGVGSVLISNKDDYTGIITDTEIVQRVIAPGLDPNITPVEKAMTAPILAIESDRSVVDANDIMDQERVRHLAVIEDGKVIGILSVKDLLRHIYGGWGVV